MRISSDIQHAMHIKRLLWVLLVVLVFSSSVSAHKSLGISVPSHLGLSYQKNILPFIAFEQTETDFTKLIEETNYCFTQYAKLSPFGDEYYPISDFGLSKKEIKELLLNADDDAILSNSKDSIQQHFMIEYFQGKIEKNINQIVRHPDFRKVNIRDLIKSDELSIVVSEDNKLFNFSFDEKTGGTYRSQLSITHYTDFAPQDPVQLSKFNSFFSSDGYNGIYTLNTNEGTKYVLTGFVRGCSSCFETSVRLIVFKDGEFKEDFMYSVMNRDWNDGVLYDHETKTIIVDYHTDDLTPFCSCSGEIDDDDEFNVDGVADDAFSIHCRCRFVFNGSTFERSSISECIRAKAEPIVKKSVIKVWKEGKPITVEGMKDSDVFEINQSLW